MARTYPATFKDGNAKKIAATISGKLPEGAEIIGLLVQVFDDPKAIIRFKDGKYAVIYKGVLGKYWPDTRPKKNS